MHRDARMDLGQVLMRQLAAAFRQSQRVVGALVAVGSVVDDKENGAHWTSFASIGMPADVHSATPSKSLLTLWPLDLSN